MWSAPWWRSVWALCLSLPSFCAGWICLGPSTRCALGRGIAHLTHGQVVEVLVANRLTAPAPLWRVDDWGREQAVEEEVFGIEPELLNDDRLGRALDAIAGRLTENIDSIGAHAIGVRHRCVHVPPGHDVHVPARRLPGR
ncbi:DUF4277 domain-containing protein [Streptomyces sp. T-3]|nr:DUF4277 domain-containing protein [Streptomyces sp. T-3]